MNRTNALTTHSQIFFPNQTENPPSILHRNALHGRRPHGVSSIAFLQTVHGRLTLVAAAAARLSRPNLHPIAAQATTKNLGGKMWRRAASKAETRPKGS
jgi:hypothetical protein